MTPPEDGARASEIPLQIQSIFGLDHLNTDPLHSFKEKVTFLTYTFTYAVRFRVCGEFVDIFNHMLFG